jgi:hypothetical protein
MANLLTGLPTMEPFDDALEPRLACVDCARSSRAGERGWNVDLDLTDEPVSYCSECARRVFGGGDADDYDDDPAG